MSIESEEIQSKGRVQVTLRLRDREEEKDPAKKTRMQWPEK